MYLVVYQPLPRCHGVEVGFNRYQPGFLRILKAIPPFFIVLHTHIHVHVTIYTNLLVRSRFCILTLHMKTQKVYLLLPIPNLRCYHPIACSGKPNPSKRQSHLGAWHCYAGLAWKRAEGFARECFICCSRHALLANTCIHLSVGVSGSHLGLGCT